MSTQVNPAAVRLTLYALLSAIELDLRSSLRTHLTSQAAGESLFTAEERAKFVERRKRAEKNPSEYVTDDELLEFLDMGDYADVALRHKALLEPRVASSYKDLLTKLAVLVPVRNRVMHSRPLEKDDFPTLYDLALAFIHIEGIGWDNLVLTLRRLQEEPQYVLRLRIPEIPWEKDSELPHNLPLPEFDDTGFIGRTKDKDDIIKLIFSHHQIVTIIGAGGVGKTAILVKSLYDILDTARDRFDAIAWVSLKNQVLTAAGITTLKTSLNSMLGLVQGIADTLGAESHTSLHAGIKEILEYLSEFRILLAIDNLEALHGNEIVEFLREIPPNSKVVITSRVGLGELELRRPLQPMDEKEAAILFRSFAQIHAVESLARLPQDQVLKICRKLYQNPLLIRWFVSSVQSGMPIQIPTEKQAEFLDYCVRNVYGKLSEPACLLLRILYAAGRPLGDAEMGFISDISPIEARRYIYEITSTMMTRASQHKLSDDSMETRYGLTDIARKYIEVHQRPTQDHVKKISKKLSELTSAVEEASNYALRDPYDQRAIVVRSPNDRVAARLLLQALAESRKGKFDTAIMQVNRAKEYALTYPDVYKISAFIRVAAGDYLGARDDYELALELTPDSPQVLYFFAGYLLRYVNDSHAALEQIQKCVKLDPGNREVRALHARILMYQGTYNEASLVFDVLLSEREQFSRKGRIKVIGMAVDCLRRWVEHLNSQRDHVKAWEVGQKAFLHFDLAFSVDSKDSRYAETFCELLLDLARTARRLPDSTGSSRLLIEKFLKLYPLIEINPGFPRATRAIMYMCGLTGIDQSMINQVRAVVDELGITWDDMLRRGQVMRVFPDRQFGFISNDADPAEEFYFEFQQIEDARTRRNLNVGDKFQYTLGRNSKGSCASDLEPL
jgi:LuxR family transcriptional regulator, glucitol operon activator